MIGKAQMNARPKRNPQEICALPVCLQMLTGGLQMVEDLFGRKSEAADQAAMCMPDDSQDTCILRSSKSAAADIRSAALQSNGNQPKNNESDSWSAMEPCSNHVIQAESCQHAFAHRCQAWEDSQFDDPSAHGCTLQPSAASNVEAACGMQSISALETLRSSKHPIKVEHPAPAAI